MTDLQRLIAYAQGERFCTARESSEMGNEIARILSVLLRVRECHKWTTGETDGSQYIGDCYMHIKCTPDTLRDLAELLGGGS